MNVEKLKTLESVVKLDKFTEYVAKSFDYEFTGKSFFTPFKIKCEESFNIGLIVGSSGSGKSTSLKQFGKQQDFKWESNQAIVSHFDTPENAVAKLSAMGLNSVPQWVKPYYALSTGEKFRADLAITIDNNAVFDEFTSVVDRTVARSACISFSKYVKKNNLKNIVIATCHRDVVEWLQPDWIFDTDTGTLNRGSLQRPSLEFKIFKSNYSLWRLFKKHHYLSHDLNKSATCYSLWYENIPIGFSAVLGFPITVSPLYYGDNRTCFRGSRTVILPDYQGLGVGARFSDEIASITLDRGYRYYSRTAHVRLGEYRQNSDKWLATSGNLTPSDGGFSNWKPDGRICYSHQYIGERGNKYRELYEQYKNDLSLKKLKFSKIRTTDNLFT